ncbi:MAG TPA: hypothetical protein PL009_14110 [Flavipsychrobacter sp.]|nr:hypothetical protein [Flavipsychrobacter sp.]
MAGRGNPKDGEIYCWWRERYGLITVIKPIRRFQERQSDGLRDITGRDSQSCELFRVGFNQFANIPHMVSGGTLAQLYGFGVDSALDALVPCSSTYRDQFQDFFETNKPVTRQLIFIVHDTTLLYAELYC